MAFQMTRRSFLQASASAALTTALSGWLVSGAQARSGFVKKPFTAPGSFADTTTVSGSFCEMCFWRCQIVGKLRDGKLVKLEGNPKSIDNGASICARGNAGVKLLYDTDRLKYPMKNVGKRGAPIWKRITWDEALDECASRLQGVIKNNGPQGVAIFPHGCSATYPMHYFEKVVGTPNSSEASFFQCRGPRDMAYINTFGVEAGESVDMPNAKAILLIGTHIGENIHVSHVKQYLKGLENGAKLIVVDPRFSSSAAKADIWVKIKPGTDTAFLLAIMNYLVKKGAYDKAYVQKNGEGFDKFAKAIAHADLEWAAKICDVPAAQIKEVADLLAKNAPHVSIHPGRHVTWYGTDFQRERALACMTALLGTVGVKGGFVKPKGPKLGKVTWPDVNVEHAEEFALHKMAEKHKFSPPGTPTQILRDAALSGKPYPIKACIAWGQNIIQTLPGQQDTIKMLQQMDFVMVVDIMPTDITMYADILLPELSYLERYDYFVKTGVQWDFNDKHQQYIAPRTPLVSQVSADHQRKNSVWITNELAKRLGHAQHIPADSAEALLDKVLVGGNISLAQIMKEDGIHLQPGKDPYGAVYPVKFFNEDLAEGGYPGSPNYTLVPEPPKGFARLVYGRVPFHTFNRSQNNVWLNAEGAENPIWLNQETAQKLGLKDGDRISLVTHDGTVSATSSILKVTQGIRKDTIFTAHGYGSRNPALTNGVKKGIDGQALIKKPAVDPETGAHGMRTSFVRIMKDGKVLSIPA